MISFFWRSIDDPIVLLRDDDSSASEANVNDVSLCAESTESDAGLFDSSENAVDSTTSAPSFSFDEWHNIDDSLKTALHLRLAEQEALTSNSIHAPPLRLLSESLHDSISAVNLHPRHVRFEVMTFCFAHPWSLSSRCTKASSENQLSQEGHLHTGWGVADEHRLVDPAHNANSVDERKRQQQQQKVKQKKDEDNDEDTFFKSEHSSSL